MPLPEFCGSETAMDLMSRARADVNDPVPRLILADWLERIHEPDAHEMCQVLRASFNGSDLVLLRQETASRLHPVVGARRGWFSGPWLGHGGELERLWLASPHTVELPGGELLELEQIPAGTFMMGSPESEEERFDDETQHEVTISKPFYMGKYPVTQAQWQAVMGNNPSDFKGERLPVENVSWDDAMAFCGKAKQKTGQGFRLPTEARWEYACRAGTTTPFHFGSQLNGTQANCDGSVPYGTTIKYPSLGKTSSVGSYPANNWGLYDMHGNVWEWCSDWYGDYGNNRVTDPQGAISGEARVLRGGSWSFFAMACRAAYRGRLYPSYRRNNYGFRVLLPLDF
ncbi:MAG: formylglycine-generating enzyme family protein [Planctomycetes bacterium]|nr:formylglycine-generating enzyme family protein [Planctomycetota bacterium]